MHLQNNEQIIKVFRHHPFTFIMRGVKIAITSIPFFFVASFFQEVLGTRQIILLYTAVSLAFIIILGYSWLIFYLDKLIISNKRIVHVDWKTLFLREENEVEFEDIQDIETMVNGILTSFHIFNYGTIKIETSASNVSIVFRNAADPEGIKHFIYHLDVKPSKITKDTLTNNKNHDSARKENPAISISEKHAH